MRRRRRVHIRYWGESWKESDHYVDQDNIKMDLRDIVLGYVDLIELAQDGD
jgi:hypothetical protein